ncbi:hypothetical protein SADUNF_Sadunf03G0088000 [Salix dunnii]|uniref:KN homeodomain domain-containing protein n=1 Tax=Salix dunnii TaxID=1413687 RepID=A0A835KDT8_9ROSI|nr:hypothetical protein SADUNF_Sadunf03G0088000 [Salix dunnii]
MENDAFLHIHGLHRFQLGYEQKEGKRPYSYALTTAVNGPVLPGRDVQTTSHPNILPPSWLLSPSPITRKDCFSDPTQSFSLSQTIRVWWSSKPSLRKSLLLLGKPGPDGMGGALGDHNRMVISIFFIRIGLKDFNGAIKALKLSSSKDDLSGRKIITESDSSDIVAWMNKPPNRPWHHHELFILVAHFSSYMGLVILSYLREANHMADGLAKQGISRSGDFTAWLVSNQELRCQGGDIEKKKGWKITSAEKLVAATLQEDDKAKFVEETGWQLKQINNWFINQRKRNWHRNSQSVKCSR